MDPWETWRTGETRLVGAVEDLGVLWGSGQTMDSLYMPGMVREEK
jgi:hypothetical protein